MAAPLKYHGISRSEGHGSQLQMVLTTEGGQLRIVPLDVDQLALIAEHAAHALRMELRARAHDRALQTAATEAAIARLAGGPR